MSVTAAPPAGATLLVAVATTPDTTHVPTAKTRAELLSDCQVSRPLHCRIEPAELLGSIRAGEVLVLRVYDAGKTTFYAFSSADASMLPYFVTSRGDAIKAAWALSATVRDMFDRFRN